MYPDEVGDISQIGDPETLYQWHLDDPVDSEELDRNDKVETHQGNRNPYVDYPDLSGMLGFMKRLPSTPTVPPSQERQ